MKTQTEITTKKELKPSVSAYVCEELIFSGKHLKEFQKMYPEYRHITYGEFSTPIREMWDYFGTRLVEETDGIILSGIGYFGHSVDRHLKVYKKKKTYTMNEKGRTAIYQCNYFPQLYKNTMATCWNFKLEAPKRQRMAELIRKGKQYICHANLLKKIKNNGRVNIFGKYY